MLGPSKMCCSLNAMAAVGRRLGSVQSRKQTCPFPSFLLRRRLRARIVELPPIRVLAAHCMKFSNLILRTLLGPFLRTLLGPFLRTLLGPFLRPRFAAYLLCITRSAAFLPHVAQIPKLTEEFRK
jgi:hypothetical protein